MTDNEFWQWVEEHVVPNLAMAVAGYVPTENTWRVELTPCLGETIQIEDADRHKAYRLAIGEWNKVA